MLVSVDEGVVDAHIGVPSDQQQGIHFQALQEDLQLGAKEAGVATFADDVVIDAHIKRGGNLGAGVSFDQVDSFRSI